MLNHDDLQVEEEESVAEEVDAVEGDPAEEEDDTDAAEQLLHSRHPKLLLWFVKNELTLVSPRQWCRI